MSELCPCGNGLKYSGCCQPYLTGEKCAPKPVILMRSRYTAYVKHNLDYLIATWLLTPFTEELKIRITENFTNTRWTHLSIIKEELGSTNDEGFVEFVAKFINNFDKKNMLCMNVLVFFV